jgi:outer membrane immunogenic protein
MNKLLTVVAALAVAVPVGAYAADMPVPSSPPPAVAYGPFVTPPPAWTGFYFGVNGGYGWGNLNLNNNFGGASSFNANGGIVGGTFGFNYQWHSFVMGFEGDVDWSGMQHSLSSAVVTGPLVVAAGTLNYKTNVVSTFAARFGGAFNHLLLYGKAGGAWTQEQYELGGTDPALGAFSGSNTFSRLGWTAGVGAEYAVTNFFTLKAEYDYMDFGNQTQALNAGSAGGTSINSKLTMNVVKVGFNWLLSGDW